MDIHVEYKNGEGTYPEFLGKMTGKKVAVAYDVNTAPYAAAMVKKLAGVARVTEIAFADEELVPDEKACENMLAGAEKADYLLAVGSGTLNDMAKYVSTRLSIDCGVLATAASMDGYASKGSALMQKGVKVTETVHTPSDILVDLDIVCAAPRLMTAAGFGDIVGKYTCLADWRMAHAVKGEPVHEEAYALMEKARRACMDAFEGLTEYRSDAVAKLMDALLTAGFSMAMCGNSRPASGSEHHISHFLEMDFVRRGERIPPHGVKVAIGTLISIELYNYIKDNAVEFNGAEEVYRLAEQLPSAEHVRDMLVRMGCPVRFSQIGVRRETMEAAIENAYTVRDRYTVLTLVHELGLTERVKPMLMEKYY